jgi:hypothetical protein
VSRTFAAEDVISQLFEMPRAGTGSRVARPAYAMRALGRYDLPREFRLGDTRWRHVHTVKHDFYACTGFYEDVHGRRAVLKMGRNVDFAGIPLEWLGRFLCRREMRFYNSLSDLPNVPKVLGTVGRTGFVHEYVEGRPLSKNRPVPDGFFAQLFALLEELHRRDIAYVDTNKPENILLGDDGRPHLIDFQISWDLRELGDWFATRWWLRVCQRADHYHVLKHHRRLRPDEMSPEELEQATRIGPMIKLHRVVTRPFKRIRRRTMQRMRDAGQLLPEGSK